MPKRQKAKKMAQRGATRKEIKRATGFSGKQAQRFINNYRPAPAPPPPPPQTSAPPQTSTPPPQTPTVALPDIKGVRQGLRIAGVGGISGSDLRTIRKATGISDEKLVKKLDKINKNLKSKDKTGISLNQGALNRIVKRATKGKGGSSRGLGFNTFDFGEGKIGQDIMSRIGSPGSQGRYVKGQLVGASEATEPRYLARGMQIRPGGAEGVRGKGKQYEGPANKVVVDGQEPTPLGPAIKDPIPNPNAEPESITPEPIEPVDTSLSSGAGGLDLASWATGFRRAKSSRRRAGRKAQGTGSMKNLKFKQQFT